MNTPYQSVTVTQELGWRDFAACKGADIRLFYPEKTNDKAKAARDICKTCPVIQICFEYALANYEQGIWGGSSVRQRTAERARRRKTTYIADPRTRLKPINHGTDGGYRAHRRRNEPACASCRRANALRKAEENARKQRGVS